MTETTLPLIELLQKQDDGDFLRCVAEAVLPLLMEHDVEGVVGVGRYERGDGRQTWRNGYRDRELKTRLGALNLRVPKLAKGLLQEVDANLRKGEPMWRETGDGHGVTLVVTDLGLAAIGINSEDARTAPEDANDAQSAQAAPQTTAEPEVAPKARTLREGTKQVRLVAMLRAPEGATVKQIMAAMGWQSHKVRGAMAGSLKKLGLVVTSEKADGAERVYRLESHRLRDRV